MGPWELLPPCDFPSALSASEDMNTCSHLKLHLPCKA